MAKLEPRSPKPPETKDLDRAVSKVLTALGKSKNQPPRLEVTPAEVLVMFAEEWEKELQKQANLLDLSTEDEEFLRVMGVEDDSTPHGRKTRAKAKNPTTSAKGAQHG